MSYGPHRGFSDHLTGRQVEMLRAAALYAALIGHPLTLFVSLNWDRTRLGDDKEGDALAWLTEQIRHWLRRHGVAVFAKVMVRERPQGPPRPNDHILIHCPRDLHQALKRQILLWVHEIGFGSDPKAVKIGRIGQGDPTETAVRGVLDYISKGVSSATGHRLGIRHSDQGRVYGKRCGVSQDIGPSAQRRHAAAAPVMKQAA